MIKVNGCPLHLVEPSTLRYKVSIKFAVMVTGGNGCSVPDKKVEAVL